MTMVSRMAKAIYEKRNGHGCKPWGQLPHDHQRPYLDDARAALTAAKVLSEAARIAAVNTQLPAWGEPPLYEKLWEAMIDAALAEGER